MRDPEKKGKLRASFFQTSKSFNWGKTRSWQSCEVSKKLQGGKKKGKKRLIDARWRNSAVKKRDRSFTIKT